MDEWKTIKMTEREIELIMESLHRHSEFLRKEFTVTKNSMSLSLAFEIEALNDDVREQNARGCDWGDE